jgi:hypothetical protein
VRLLHQPMLPLQCVLLLLLLLLLMMMMMMVTTSHCSYLATRLNFCFCWVLQLLLGV